MWLGIVFSTSTSVIGVHAACGWRCIPGGPCDVSIDDSSVQQAALSAAVSFNNQSNDSFLFRPDSQRQVQSQREEDFDYGGERRTEGRGGSKEGEWEEMGRERGRLWWSKWSVFRCHVEVWDVPWSHHSIIQRLSCKTLSSAAQRSESQPVRDSD
uniref:Uncharacterized protein n=1 Tax=Periophthalmus magnuspinnatus TaxID=409849 RepID=A0A3B3Z686_9GOBI